jgi:hypothetical protein
MVRATVSPGRSTGQARIKVARQIRGGSAVESIVKKLTSRKLWVTVLAGALVTLSEHLGLELDPEQIYGLVALAVGYAATQAHSERGGP